MFNLDTYR